MYNSNFRVWSSDFTAGGFFSKDQALNDPKFGSFGKNISPEILWDSPPKNTNSFALTVFDPDAPTGSGFWHWVVVNISNEVRFIRRGAGFPDANLLPRGAVQLHNDYGKIGFGGWAPPKGDKPHRYVFRLHAIKMQFLPVDHNTTNALTRFMIHLNEIDSVSITGLYGNT